MSELASADVNGIDLAYRASGPSAAPVVVLLHALGETGQSWAQVASALAVEHRVYALDLRGHGDSDHSGDYRLESMRDDVIGFLDQLGSGPVTVIGHSMGAVVGYLVAEQRPELVRALVLEDPAPPFPPQPRREVPWRPDGPLAFDWAVVEVLTVQRNNPPSVWWERLTEITAPTLVIGGGPDSHLPQDLVEAMALRIPNGRFTTIAAGHEVHKERPKEFIAALGAFLAAEGERIS